MNLTLFTKMWWVKKHSLVAGNRYGRFGPWGCWSLDKG
jgi:hypothetical protein